MALWKVAVRYTQDSHIHNADHILGDISNDHYDQALNSLDSTRSQTSNVSGVADYAAPSSRSDISDSHPVEMDA